MKDLSTRTTERYSIFDVLQNDFFLIQFFWINNNNLSNKNYVKTLTNFNLKFPHKIRIEFGYLLKNNFPLFFYVLWFTYELNLLLIESNYTTNIP